MGDTMYLVKKDDETIIKTKGDCKGKIAKPNRNIKPFVHVNNEIKVLWEIDGNIDINKKIFSWCES
jgi:hypothetical protein